MLNALNLAFIASISNFNVIDLTHTIDEHVRVWDGSCGFRSELTYDYDLGGFRGQQYTMRSCLGTHMDVPAHCFKDGKDCSNIPLEKCIAPACIIDITSKSHEDYAISTDDIQEFENSYGIIKPDSLVIFSTGWAKRWHDPSAFRNEKLDGVPHFPYLSKEAAELLLSRNIVGIGIDTLSPDAFYLEPVVHKLFLGSGKYIIESIANLKNMPPIGGYIIALPLKIAGGVESPIRLIGLVAK